MEQYIKEKYEKWLKADLPQDLKEQLASKEGGLVSTNTNEFAIMQSALYKKISQFRDKVRHKEFIFDKELPSNLGGGNIILLNNSTMLSKILL